MPAIKTYNELFLKCKAEDALNLKYMAIDMQDGIQYSICEKQSVCDTDKKFRNNIRTSRQEEILKNKDDKLQLFCVIWLAVQELPINKFLPLYEFMKEQVGDPMKGNFHTSVNAGWSFLEALNVKLPS